jgi:hypothetical protein
MLNVRRMLGSALVACALSMMSVPLALAQAKPAAAPAAKVDINTASEKELVDLPGIGPATAKKIIAGRPFASVADLAKAGVPKNTLDKITPLVTASAAKMAAPVQAAAPAKPAPAPAAAPAAKTMPAPATPPPVKGMVWVNTSTKVFHREGDRYYGNTKQGKYMTEADALKAGFREAKAGGEKKK